MCQNGHTQKFKIGPQDHQIRVRSVRFPPRGSEKRELCRKGHIQKNRTLNLRTTELESGASDLPPQGPKKESYVERDTFKTNEKDTSGPPNSSPGRPISPQRVQKKRVISKRTHCKNYKIRIRDHRIRARSVRFSPRGSEKRELCRKGHIPTKLKN